MTTCDYSAGIAPGSISQMCFATRDMSLAVKKWTSAFGAGPFFEIALPQPLPRIYRGRPAEDRFAAVIGFMGSTLIEFLQPLNDAPSIIQEILTTRGEGALHHIYPCIRPLNAVQFDAARSGYRALGYKEALSFEMPGMGRNVFFDAVATLGCFVELLEFGTDAYEATLGPIHAAHMQGLRSGAIEQFAPA